MTKLFADRSEAAKRSMELLGLMLGEPNIRSDELRSIQVPTLIVAGTRDMIKRDHTEEIAKNIPNAKLFFIGEIILLQTKRQSASIRKSSDF